MPAADPVESDHPMETGQKQQHCSSLTQNQLAMLFNLFIAAK